MTDQLTFLNISERAYKYIRQFTIKSIQDALVELITNSIDAYGKANFDNNLIEIEIVNQDTVIVRDLALGLTSDQLNTCFLQIGNFTSDTTSRGFFSRGAKDISALGNLTFDTIKNNKYSQCVLNTDAYGSVLIKDIDVTDEMRNNIKIPTGKNGLQVTIKLLPTFQNINIDNIYKSISKIAVLRNIIADKKNIIYLREYDNSGLMLSEKIITYTYPIGTLLLDIHYDIPNYPGKKASMCVYKSDKPIIQPVNENELEFGFLIEDSTSVYEVNTISDRFRWNPYMNYIYGYVECEDIHSFLIDYDVNGPSETNPYPIIDPSRITGINKQHPFIINLFSIPLVRVDGILRNLNKSLSSNLVAVEDVDDLVNELHKYGSDLIEQKDIKVSFTTSYDENLIKSIQEDRSKYVSYENNYVLDNSYDVNESEAETDAAVLSQLQNLNPEPADKFVMDQNNKLINIYKDMNFDPTNKPTNILSLIPSDTYDSFKKNPLIYNLGKDPTTGERKLEKLYIFEKGSLDEKSQKGPDTLTIKKKKFSIVFIDDINIQKRYIIDSMDGVMIQINLHNEIVKKYLVNEIDSMKTDTTTTLKNLSSTKTIMFMKELMTSIMVDLICENDVKNNKLILNCDSYTNGKKIIDYRNTIVTDIELSIDSIFEKMIVANKDKKVSGISDLIEQISGAFSENTDLPDNVKVIKDNLMTYLSTNVE